jgi:SagB-type dehydrogenase family enzyme
MTNRDLEATWKYHNATKHSYASVRNNPHGLDWANKPLEYKMYPTLEITRLPTEAKPTGVPALKAISETISLAGNPKGAVPDLETLAQILFLSAGITKSKKYPGGEQFFRAAACTGALYEIELYLVCGELPDFPAGLYHFGVAEFGLRQLRAGDYRRVVAEFTGNERSLLHAPVIAIFSGTYWRNAWKYQARTYRHFGWDNGTMIANMLAVSTALGLPAKVLTGFADESVNKFLALDTHREVAFSMVSLGYSKSKPAKVSGEIPRLDLPLLAPSKSEVDYPLMREMHAASSLVSPEEVAEWRTSKSGDTQPVAKGNVIALPAAAEPELPASSIEEVILRRGSSRKFAEAPISIGQLSILLDRATRGVPADFVGSLGTRLNDIYLIVNAVEGLKPGAYFYERGQHGLELLRNGNFRKMAGYLGLEQELPAAASVCIFFLADLKAILEHYGNRGYRGAQLEAGILGGKLYIAAYAQGLGASGLTFYDDDVVRFFSPHAEGKSAIFLMAVGKSSRSLQQPSLHSHLVPSPVTPNS